MSIIIKRDGDTWKIIGQGASREGLDGGIEIYCHLASTTRGRQQKNGWYPLQICDWIDRRVILSAAIRQEEAQRKARYTDIVSDGGMDVRDRAITAFYTDRANGSHAAKAP